ncbi:mannose-1-phosphate guanylyltransferase/mannose-6-phosphate isomerase [Alcaligenes phenolicus]|uniref:mannose-1-phosphate guanylyltransferase/mannose-6-phosphate isomerase n=1 Tax=Alcaligenes phenolicus TaxID=232846 RepID=UPI002AA786DA|nr:mannose-1-phosphate guanylyltransferase/mannose-6-phosphate isomerase [Alcaligenes phenolicus]
MVIPIILAGGHGSRLWPLSRQLNPKQFLAISDDKESLLHKTLTRLNGLEFAPPLLICNEEHRFLAAEQLRQLNMDQVKIILEPVGRNTAPAIALAALYLLNIVQKDPDTVLLVLAADHLIPDTAAFHSSVSTALYVAQSGKLATFGVVPTRAETGYGYIQRGPKLEAKNPAFVVKRFVEKPELSVAEAYVASGEYYWNSGMFMFKASRYLEELEQHYPEILAACRLALSKIDQDMDFIRIDADHFSACPSESIDYAVMEKTDSAAVVPLDAGWNDIGAWSAVWDTSTKNAQGNVCIGDIITHNSTNNYLRAESRLIATVGVDNLIVVETKDAVLVAHRDAVQDVKQLVDQIKRDGRHEHLVHREVYRPWGIYDSIDTGHRYQVKRITVKPGAKLSVQMHHHRAEHWIVVSGTAKVTKGEQVYLVTENQSTYIPVGEIHALENPGVIPLELIEVQSGSYLGEDDIVRFEDRYGRVDKDD